MLKTGKDELICDLAETYHIFNLDDYPISTIAILSAGLNDNSRIKRKLSNTPLTIEQSLLSVIADGIQILCWSKTEDAQKGRNRPPSIYQKLMGLDDNKKDDLVSFATIEEFESYMKQKRMEWKQ